MKKLKFFVSAYSTMSDQNVRRMQALILLLSEQCQASESKYTPYHDGENRITFYEYHNSEQECTGLYLSIDEIVDFADIFVQLVIQSREVPLIRNDHEQALKRMNLNDITEQYELQKPTYYGNNHLWFGFQVIIRSANNTRRGYIKIEYDIVVFDKSNDSYKYNLDNLATISHQLDRDHHTTMLVPLEWVLQELRKLPGSIVNAHVLDTQYWF